MTKIRLLITDGHDVVRQGRRGSYPMATDEPYFLECRLGEVRRMFFMPTSCEFRRTIAPFRARPLVFVTTDFRRRASLRMPVVCQCRRIWTSPGYAKNAYLCGFADVPGPARTHRA